MNESPDLRQGKARHNEGVYRGDASPELPPTKSIPEGASADDAMQTLKFQDRFGTVEQIRIKRSDNQSLDTDKIASEIDSFLKKH